MWEYCDPIMTSKSGDTTDVKGKPDPWKIVSRNRYCTGYRKSIFSKRSVNSCMNWVKQVDPHARWFFFRSEGNHHCSPCPQSYKGHPTIGTGRQNSRIYIYEIYGWKHPGKPQPPPTPKPKPPPGGGWDNGKWKRIANGRYCVGYKKSIFSKRSVADCANWVRQVDKAA